MDQPRSETVFNKKGLSELQGRNSESDAVLAHFGHPAHRTKGAGKLGQVRCPAEGARHLGLAPVNGHVRRGANVEGIVLVIRHFNGVNGVALARLGKERQ